MSLIVDILTAGASSHPTPSEAANYLQTDFVSAGVVGAISNTSGVAPSTGAFAANAQGTPDMTVAITAGKAYVTATPSAQGSQLLRVNLNANQNVTIAANASGGTRFDWIYISMSAANAAAPNAAADNVATLVTSRSTSATTDNGTPPTYGYCIAVVTVANGAVTITNGTIADSRTASGVTVASGADGWTNAAETWTYASATTITVPTNATLKYAVGDKIKLTQTTVKYFYVTGVAATTLTITGGSDYTLVNATISNNYYSKNGSPVGFPAGFAFTPTWTSSGTAPAIGNGTFTGNFSILGRNCYMRLKFVGGSTTTWGTGAYSIALPVAGYTGIAANDGFDLSGYAEDNTVASAKILGARLKDTTTFYVQMEPQGSSTVSGWAATLPFTWGTGDYWSATGFYGIA